jgi:prepilin-type N-terminal cleavage/methylation domain-containing protein
MTSATGEARGFTLVELCFTVTIVGLIAGVCWPSLKTMAQSLSARSSAAAFAHELQTARERAVMSGLTQHVPAPLVTEAQASSAEAMLLPDGTARRLQVLFGPAGHTLAMVDLDEAGRVLLTTGFR